MITNALPPLTTGEFALFQRLIHESTGIHLGEAKKTLLVGRLGKRLRALGLSSFGEYYRHLTHNRANGEFQTMVDLVTTNETYFFREQQHFDFLRTLLANHQAERPFHVWSAAASTGEEAYSLCMVLTDELGIDGNWTVSGTDISQSVLQTAARGRYELARVRGLPTAYLHRYCLKGIGSQSGSFVVDRRLRAHTRFLHLNLTTDLPRLGPFDLILLRNVMIYFDAPTKAGVIRRLADTLRPGGHLIVGHAETLNGLDQPLVQIRPTIYRKPT